MWETDNPRLAAYLRVVFEAESLTFWSGVEGITMQGFAASYARAILHAYGVGLSEHEISMAAHIGEHRAQPKRRQSSEAPPPKMSP